mmetsp:Transcript_45852/g.121205  ORF Transcript_45852/g.121205 Transcript_45852/m.121205 type:complete len:181 (-) Transcript_45852:65-607(-)
MGCLQSSSALEPLDPVARDEKLARRLQAQENRQGLRLPVAPRGGGEASAPERLPRAPQATLLGAQYRRGWGGAGAGHQLGKAASADAGDGPGAAPRQTLLDEEEKRRLCASDAAERRQVPEANVSQARAAELRERRQKEDLLGKLTEHYVRKRKEIPMGLNACSVQQLRKHWDSVRPDSA